MTQPHCRFCKTPLIHTFVDLGLQPLANSYLTAEQLAAGNEPVYPLHARVCHQCFLVQVDDVVPADHIFDDAYAYFSAYSTSWVEHARRYAVAMAERFGLGPESLVVEVASNDGYLLKHFLARDVPVLGIEPTANTAEAARAIAAAIARRMPAACTTNDKSTRGEVSDAYRDLRHPSGQRVAMGCRRFSDAGGGPALRAWVDDSAAQKVGMWKQSTSYAPYIGTGYLSDNNEGKGEKTVTFTPKIPKTGRYEVRVGTSSSRILQRAHVTLAADWIEPVGR